jgi:hypothetical protein
MSKFSIFQTVRDTVPSDDIAPWELIRWVRSDDQKALVDAIRSAPDKDTRSKYKARLPAVTASGVFSKRSASALVEHSGILIADLDLDDNPQLMDAMQMESIKQKLICDNRPHFYFVSPSGGLKVGVKIDATCANSHKAAFATVREWFANDHGLIIDKACSDVSRLCFLSHDPSAYYNAKSIVIKTEAAKAAATPFWQPAPVAAPMSGTTPGDQFNERADVEGLLRSQGWTTRNGKHWTRPGKSGGISGTFGVVGDRKFYCWTSAAAPLEPNQSYSPFALFATFHHGGDFGAAASALAAEGYGERSAPQPLPAKDVATIEALVANALQKEQDSFRKIEQEIVEAKNELEAVKQETEKESMLGYLRRVNVADAEALENREKTAREMVFVLPGIAARGQATVIYASPNSGKTLITCHLLHQQLTAGALGDLTVVYCNFDDDFIGCNMKGRYFVGTGLILIDNQLHTPEDVLKMMEAAIKEGTAGELCFVLDTLIRFVSDSDKQTQRAFTGLIQRFVGAQGTIIALGHTNKHKDGEGKSVHGGTSDIRNSFSQAAILELESDPEAVGTRQVRFYNDKLRGMAKCSNTYSYTHGDEKNWIERVQTVRNVNETEAKANIEQFIETSQRNQDKDIIACIKYMLSAGPMPTRDIVRAKGDDIAGTHRDRERVLRQYAGKDWHESRGQNGGTNYYLDDWEPPKHNVVNMVPWE